jgi:hypothetical protein
MSREDVMSKRVICLVVYLVQYTQDIVYFMVLIFCCVRVWVSGCLTLTQHGALEQPRASMILLAQRLVQ